MGHSPGIGYPSSCFIPNDLQQTTVHSYSGGFIGLPTQLIVARVCSCQPTMLKKFDYVVMMTGSKASEPITSFLVLGGLTTPSQFFFFFFFFFFSGSKASEPITSFLVLGGAYYPIAVFLMYFVFFLFFFVFCFRRSPEGTMGHCSSRLRFFMRFFTFS